MTEQKLYSSVFVHLLKHLLLPAKRLSRGLKEIYRNSWTCRLIEFFRARSKICLRNSILGRITESRPKAAVSRETSKTVLRLTGMARDLRKKWARYKHTSSTIQAEKNLEKEYRFLPLRFICGIIVVSIFVNVFLSLILHKEISPWGWLMRGLFFLASVPGLFSKADWPTIKKHSLFFRFLSGEKQ